MQAIATPGDLQASAACALRFLSAFHLKIPFAIFVSLVYTLPPTQVHRWGNSIQVISAGLFLGWSRSRSVNAAGARPKAQGGGIYD
jgi:hypothetical protein